MGGIIELGASFSISSDYIEARTGFDPTLSRLIYVEGFEDIPFWKKIFKNKNISVDVEAFGQKNKANGKGTISNAIRNKNIILGEFLMVALDSDYDYLLENNSDIFDQKTVFQTYAYSIENLQWNPSCIDNICQIASNNTILLPDDNLKTGLIEWSCAVFPLFLKYLKGGASDTVQFSKIINSLQRNDNSVCCHGLEVEPFTDLDFIEKMKSKGLVPETVYLFVRGHDYADRLEDHCQNVTRWVFDEMIKVLKSEHGNNAGQFIGELKNKQSEPRIIIKGYPVLCELCTPKINADIDFFVTQYH